MTPRLLRFGHGGHPVVVVDDFSGDWRAVGTIAADLAPFPQAPGHYPGVRRVIRTEDEAADDYANATLERAAPFIGGAFGLTGFDLVEASFSIVTTPPGALSPPQRAPHFDTTDPRHLAVLHYLFDRPGSGTAFFRHRATGIERVDEALAGRFVTAVQTEGPGSGYVAGSDARFEEIGRVEAVPDRLLIYQGALLHSGVIPSDMPLDADPLRGRLTANLFIQG